jgi:hypothetical protein
VRKITFAQARYLNTLAQQCRVDGVELPEEVWDKLRDLNELTAEEAGELIEDLKFELGWGE